MPAGFIWLCGTCLDQTKKTGLIAYDTEQTNVEPNSELESEGQTTDPRSKCILGEKKTNEAMSTPQPSGPKKKITCKYYKIRACKHGSKGKECEYGHPPKCLKFVRHGTKGNQGCNRGDKCRLYHPPACRDSINKGICFNQNCKFLHIRGTKRQNSQFEMQNKQTETVPARVLQRPNKNVSLRADHRAESRRTEPFASYNQQRDQPEPNMTRSHINPGSSDFLELQEDMQYMKRKVEQLLQREKHWPPLQGCQRCPHN